MKTPALIAPYEKDAKRLWLTRPHPIVLFGFVFYLAVALICGGVVFEAISTGGRDFITGLIVFFFGLIGLQMLGLAVVRGITYFTSYLLITDHHVVVLQGIARNLSKLTIEDIELTGTTETLLGRLLGYGRLLVAPASGDYLPTFPVAEPNSLEILINDCRKSSSAP
ncbi:hypothetical protein [Marinobacter sp.]|uniref:hypothetical protein n=1 Tax=Marinobacter sp. TaxID=50741 RepID=UPI00356B1BF7